MKKVCGQPQVYINQAYQDCDEIQAIIVPDDTVVVKGKIVCYYYYDYHYYRIVLEQA